MLQVKKSNKPIREITAIYLCVVTLCLIFSISAMDLSLVDKSSQRKSYARKITSREEASSAYSQVNSFLPLTCTQHSQKRSSGFKAFNRAYGYFLQVSLLRRTDEPQYQVPNSCGRLQSHSVWVPARRSQSSSAIADVTSPVKIVGRLFGSC